ncbi:MAG TPA: peptidase, partial [Candidatus Methylomirabilis sp.]|nr:peptidase [Candidatus Methylomirabilis sp.]
VAQRKAGMPLRTLEDLKGGEALYQEFTNALLREQGYDVPLLSPAAAGARLAALAARYDFTMFEFFQTDLCGHAQDFPRALRLLQDLDAFLTAVLAGTDLGRDLVVVGSDHGNLEDLSRKTHTANPVPTMVWGAGAEAFASRIRTIADLAPAILDSLGVVPAGPLAKPSEND